MRDRFKDLAFLAIAVGITLGGFYTFQRIRYHDQMDRALIQILQKQASQEK